MEELFEKIKSSRGKESIEIIKEWMEAYSLELKRVDAVYAIYSNTFEPAEKIADVVNEEDLIEVVAEHIELFSQDSLLSDAEFVNLDYDYKILTGEHLKGIEKVNILERLIVTSKECLKGANIELRKKSEDKGLKIRIGSCEYSEVQAVSIEEDLIKVLEKYEVKYSSNLKELTKGIMKDSNTSECIELELDGEKYEIYAWAGNLELDGCYTTSNWIDFNEIVRK